jgi:hypothetical protein
MLGFLYTRQDRLVGGANLYRISFLPLWDGKLRDCWYLRPLPRGSSPAVAGCLSGRDPGVVRTLGGSRLCPVVGDLFSSGGTTFRWTCFYPASRRRW